jgi:hypothetical protein
MAAGVTKIWQILREEQAHEYEADARTGATPFAGL